jgi:hypothetical protein
LWVEENVYINITPSKVRLVPRLTDLYKWEFIPKKRRYYEEIFKKNLSDYSISSYRVIYNSILAKDIKAVHVNTSGITVSEEARRNMTLFLIISVAIVNRY